MKVFLPNGEAGQITDLSEYIKDAEAICDDEGITIVDLIDYQYSMYLLYRDELKQNSKVKYTVKDLQEFMNLVLALGEYVFGSGKGLETFLQKLEREYYESETP